MLRSSTVMFTLYHRNPRETNEPEDHRLSRAVLQLAARPRPELVSGYRAAHQAYMPSVPNEKLFVLATEHARRWLCLGQRTDVVLLPCDVQDGAPDIREVHPLPAELELALGELVFLIEVSDPLPKSLTGKGHAVVYPLAHC